MTPYSLILSLHVVTAVLGLGPLAAILVLTPQVASFEARLLQRIMRVVIASLGLMLITGVALVALVHGAFGETWWLRLSVLLFFGLGFLHSRIRRTTRGNAPLLGPEQLRRVNRICWIMCVDVAAIVYLMAAKPW